LLDKKLSSSECFSHLNSARVDTTGQKILGDRIQSEADNIVLLKERRVPTSSIQK
jgi:hypothetical protein